MMRDLEGKMNQKWTRQALRAAAHKEGGRMTKFVIDQPKLARKMSIAGIGIGALAALLRDNEKDQRLEEPFQFAGYEEAGEYERYKASIGEYAEPGFQSAPVSTTDPFATAGAVQYLHDNKTRSHQMGSRKYDHLYGL